MRKSSNESAIAGTEEVRAVPNKSKVIVANIK